MLHWRQTMATTMVMVMTMVTTTTTTTVRETMRLHYSQQCRQWLVFVYVMAVVVVAAVAASFSCYSTVTHWNEHVEC